MVNRSPRVKVRRARWTAFGFLVFGILCQSTQAVSQQQDPPQDHRVVQGVVYDSLTGRPVPGAAVFLEDAQLRVFTNSSGLFTIEVAPGRHLLAVTRFGYQEKERRVSTSVADGHAGMIEVPLVPEPIRLEGVTATAAPVTHVPIHGIVYDATTGAAVAGAAIVVAEEERGVLSDSLGIFRLDSVATGPQLLITSQFGYEKQAVLINLHSDFQGQLELALAPQPILLDGVTAVVDNIETMDRRLRFRRRAGAGLSRAYDQEQLLRSGAGTALDFLNRETLVRTAPCPPGELAANCVIRRGRLVNPAVYVNEIPAFGGLDDLAFYANTDIYLLEVLSGGSEVRVYTYAFMERMARRPMALIPLSLWPRIWPRR